MSDSVYTPTEAEVEEALTHENYKAWLDAKAGEEVVGTACTADFCPIAAYLAERFPGTKVSALPKRIFVGAGPFSEATSVETPDLINDFMEAIDAWGVTKRSTGPAPVPASVARRLLAEVTAKQTIK